MKAEIVILGSGTSMGVPTLGCSCAVCTSSDARNARSRPSIAVQWPSGTVVIDTGQDFRRQALREGIQHIDAVLYTHAHADHILGMDDLRPLSFRHPNGLPLYADDTTSAALHRVFEYTLSPRAEYPTRARVDLRSLNGHESVRIAGLRFQRVPILHGDLTVGGYRFGSAAYLTDMNSIPEGSLLLLEGLDTLIIDALRWQHHPSHNNVEQALEWIERIRPRRAFLTHIAHELEHTQTEAALPGHIRLAYDGLRIPIEI
ncbi:MAG TPA: MBL fold metallo-hydrolase [Acidobacteriaceae bacterium]|nr:MBL fold metallo-hydrolase [Acidobacteriaceae bacterium]